MYHKKPYLIGLERTRAGTYRDSSSGLFLDRNERSVAYNKELIESLYRKMKDVPLNLYPEINPLYKKLSDWLSFPENQIYVTEGVSGAIKSIIETLTFPGKHNIIFPYPTFALYPVYCKMFNVEAKLVNYTNDYNLDVSHLIQLIDDQTAIVFLPNPNMPIEGAVSLNELEIIADQCNRHNVILAVDEVYYPFGGPSAIGLINQFDNVFVMRSFSKAFGLAGIRIGYLLGTHENIEYVSKTRTGYETNSVSMEIAMFFIDNFDEVLVHVSEVKKGLEYLKKMLAELEIETNGGVTGNFLFVNLNDKRLANVVVEELRKKKIFIRGGWPNPYDTGFSVTGAPINIMEDFFHEFALVFRSLKN